MRWIIVTGDSGGLGSLIVRTLLNKGLYGVIGISRKTTPVIENTIKDDSDRYVHIDYDFECIENIKNLYLDKLRKIGPIHGLVNNAAFAYDDLATNANVDLIDRMFRINVLSPMMLTKYCIRDMLLHKTKGSIVYVSSVSTLTGYKGLSMYAASKGALEAYSKGLAREWGSVGIRSNTVSPGFMETKMSETLTSEQKQRIYRRTSLKEQTSIESVAHTIEFLLSNAACSITGQNIRVDNGTV